MADLSVLLVMHELTRAGASRLALSIFRELTGQVDLRIIADQGGALGDDYAQIGDLTVLRNGVFPGLSRRLLAGSELQRVIEWAYGQTRARFVSGTRRGRPPDVVYINSVAALPMYADMRRVRVLHRPTVLHVHELGVMIDECERLAPGLLGSVPDAYVAVSEAVAGALSDRIGVPDERVRVIHPRLEPHWLTDPARPMRSKPGDPFVVGGVGIPGWTKGGELWLLTAAHLLRQAQTARFAFRWIGLDDSPASRQFEAMAQKLGLQGVVELLPFEADLTRAYESFDLLLVSSWEDSAPLVALEAMANGRPVACFRGAGGAAELVGDTGLVVDEFSPIAMAEAIERLAAAPDRWRSLCAAARERVERHFSGDHDGRVLALLRELVAAGSQA